MVDFNRVAFEDVLKTNRDARHRSWRDFERRWGSPGAYELSRCLPDAKIIFDYHGDESLQKDLANPNDPTAQRYARAFKKTLNPDKGETSLALGRLRAYFDEVWHGLKGDFSMLRLMAAEGSGENSSLLQRLIERTSERTANIVADLAASSFAEDDVGRLLAVADQS